MFVKNDNDSLIIGDNFVYAPTFTLTKETNGDFTYPIDGWYWFDTIEEAYEFFGITKGADLDGL